jgi:hypothetical protein
MKDCSRSTRLIIWAVTQKLRRLVDSARRASLKVISAPVEVGNYVSLQQTSWPEKHYGPMLNFLAASDGDCSIVDKTQLKFFKTDGDGMMSFASVSVRY